MPPPESDESAETDESAEMQDALRWLVQVEGRILCKQHDPEAPDGWVAVVKTPAPIGRKAQVILGFGSSAVEAVETARASWDQAWREISTLH